MSDTSALVEPAEVRRRFGHDEDAMVEQIAELAYRVSFLENMYLDKRTDHERALAAEAALREIHAVSDGVLSETWHTAEIPDWAYAALDHICGISRRAASVPAEEAAQT